MITCFKCKRELEEVSDIGEMVRSYDGNDFCFCKKCQQELAQIAEIIPKNLATLPDEEEDCSYVLDDLREAYAFADEGIYPIGDWCDWL